MCYIEKYVVVNIERGMVAWCETWPAETGGGRRDNTEHGDGPALGDREDGDGGVKL